MSKITLEDTTIEVVTKMSEGIIGAVTVLMQLLEKGGAIDPDDFAEGFGSILSLDTHGIYGSEIWMLYKDVCGGDLVKMVGMLRAVQLGFLPEKDLKFAINNRGEGVDCEDLLSQVRERLPKFGQ